MSALAATLALTFLVCVAALALVALLYGFRHTLWLLEQRRVRRRRGRVRSLS